MTTAATAATWVSTVLGAGVHVFDSAAADHISLGTHALLPAHRVLLVERGIHLIDPWESA